VCEPTPAVPVTTHDPTTTARLGRSPILALVPEAIRRLQEMRVRREAPGRPQLDEFVTMTREVVSEHEGEATCIAGAVPAGLDARYVAGGWYAPTTPPIAHLLDAYSTLVSWTFRGGRARVASRSLEDPLRDAEVAAGRVLRKGLGTPTTGSFLARVTAAIGRPNVHECVAFGDAVLAISTPRALWVDPDTLAIRAEAFTDHFDPRDPGITHNNHPQVDPRTGRLVTAVFRHTPVFSTEMDILELDAGGRRVGGRRNFWPGFVAVHAFGFSASSYVLPDNPLRPPDIGYLLGLGRGVLAAMRETTRRALQLHVIPRGGGPALTVALSQRGFIYHLLNCYDDGDLTMVDAFVSNLNPRAESSQFELDPRYPVETHLGGVLRFAIDRTSGAVTSRLLVTGVQRVTFDAIDERRRGQPYRHAWFVSNDQHEGGRSDVIAADVTTGDIQRWTTRERVFLRQPRLVPTNADAPEGHGWLLVPAYTPRDTRLMIFDAARVPEGPVAVVAAGLRLPYTNHGCVQ
jgi:carotenoid cleavage dioxygenase-like enzyme